MATIRFELKDPKAKKQTRIMCILTDTRTTRIKLSTGISTKKEYWSKTTRLLKPSAPSSAIINNRLREFKDLVLDHYLMATNAGIIPDRKHLAEQIAPSTKPEEIITSFWGAWTKFEELKIKSWKPATTRKIRSLKNHLEKYEETNSIAFDLESISDITFELIEDYLSNTANLNRQTTAGYLKLVRTFFRWAHKRELITSGRFMDYEIKHQPESLKVIIEDHELELLRNLQIPRTKEYLENARKLFILSILTGLRYSDYSDIKKAHLKMNAEGKPILEKRQVKNNQFVTIPLTDEAYTLCYELVSGKLRAISNQKVNSYIKDVCELAEIDELFETKTFKGNSVISETKKKYELITTHTGRRTFATRLLLKGIPAETVMKFTGHRDFKSFSKYVNIPKKVEEDQIRRALEA